MTVTMDPRELLDASAQLGDAADAQLAGSLVNHPEERPDVRAARFREGWPAYAELGWFDVLVPEADGGLGLPAAALGDLFCALGRRLAPGPFAANAFVGPWLEGRGDADATALRAARRAGAVLALADPEGGGRATASSTVRLERGRLDGSVELVPYGADAERLLVVVQGDAGPGLVVVPREREGVTTRRHVSVDGASAFATLSFDGCRVATDEVVRLNAAALLREMRAWLRILAACELRGVVEAVVPMSVAYAGQREQFGRPIGAFQAVKHLLAEMAVEASVLRNLTRHVLVDGGPLALEAMALKARASRGAMAVCERALQVHGGIAFTMEYGLHPFVKRAMSLSSAYGQPTELEVRIGRATLGIEAGSE